MEGNYPPGYYGIEREQQERRLPPSQQQQQQPRQPAPEHHHQQHPAHYPLDLPIPYFAPGQHQPGYVEDNPSRGFPGPHHGPGVPASSMLRSFYHDPNSVHLAANILHEAHHQRPSALGGHEPIRQTHPMATHDPIVDRNVPSVTPLQSPMETNASSSKTREQITENEVPVSTSESTVNNVALISTSTHDTTTEESVEFGKIRETEVENDVRVITSNEPQPADNTQEQRNDNDSEPGPSKEMQTKQTSSHQPDECPSSPGTTTVEPQLFAALNLKKNSSFLDLPTNLSLIMASRYKIEGVVAKEVIEVGAEFGPYTGDLVDEEKGMTKESTWEICISDEVFFYIDGHKTWMSHLKCAQKEDEQNVEVYQHCGKIYFRTTTVVEPGCELRAFYSEEYGKAVGIQSALDELTFNEDKQRFQCDRCEDLFTSAKLLLRHTKYKHTSWKSNDKFPVVTWRKRKKPEPLKIKISIKRQCKSQNKRKVSVKKADSHKCGICNKTFTTAGRLKAHEIFHEEEDDDDEAADDDEYLPKAPSKRRKKQENKKFECKECGEMYDLRSSLTRHERQVHGYACRFCKERFPKKAECTKHEETHQAYKTRTPRKRREREGSENGIQPSEPTPEELQDMLGRTAEFHRRLFKCRFCPKRYSCRSSAVHHELEVHTGEGKFKCQHCSKSFSSEYRYKDHLAVHQYVNMYHCTLCPRSFASESALNNHQGEHTGLKPFKCDVCGRGFRTRKLALKHKGRVHRDRPKRFQCSTCSKAFAERSDLKVHERRHKGIRQYVCLECGRGFTSSSSLQAHMLGKHSKEKPFVCQLCGKSFALNHQFNRHMAKHRAEGATNIANIYSSIPPQQPTTQPQQQVASKHQPRTSAQQPRTSAHQPLTSTQHSLTSTHQPLTATQQQLTSTQHPPVSTQQSLSTTPQPFTYTQHPLASTAQHHQFTTIQLQHLVIPPQQLTTPPPQKLL